jgi:hypothetical protein
MGKALDYLTSEWLEARLATTKAWHVPRFEEVDRERAGSPEESIPTGTPPGANRGNQDGDEDDSHDKAKQIRNCDDYRLGCLISRCIALCECEYALGASPDVIRDHCRIACESAIPYVRLLDFSVKHVRREDGMSPSSAKEIAERYGGTWWNATGQYAGAEYSCKNEPLALSTRLNLWYIAALSGNPDLACEVASLYQADVARQVASNSVREGLLRCALARDADGEALLAGRVEPGYPADFPPQLIELPLGVIRHDSGTILDAVRKIGTKIKGKWDLKKHRGWYDKRQPQNPGRRHPNGTWEQCLARTKDALLAHHWVFSWWAIAWLELARQRGLREVFAPKNRKAFSEWVPFALLDRGATA